MNKVILMGRLTRDPEVRYTQTNNTLVASFSLAVNRRFTREGDAQTADFINIVAWGKLGENVAKYTGKGLRVLVTGRIQTGSYEKDGQRIYTTDIQAANVEFLDWKDGNSSGSNYSNSSSNSNSSNDSFTAPIDDDFEYSADFDPTEDKRIPF